LGKGRAEVFDGGKVVRRFAGWVDGLGAGFGFYVDVKLGEIFDCVG